MRVPLEVFEANPWFEVQLGELGRRFRRKNPPALSLVVAHPRATIYVLLPSVDHRDAALHAELEAVVAPARKHKKVSCSSNGNNK